MTGDMASSTKPEDRVDLIDRFISADDDAIGHIALSLLFIEIMRSTGEGNRSSFLMAAQKVDDMSISVLYRGAASRIAHQYMREKSEAKASEDARNSQIYRGLNEVVHERTKIVLDEIRHYKEQVEQYNAKNSFLRQTAYSGLATVLVGLGAVVVVFAPTILEAIRNFIR